MLKTKYKFFKIKKAILYNKLETLLEKESKNGWTLIQFTNFFLKFKKDEPINAKYQIDFSKPTSEYKDLLKYEGYEFVDNYEELSIYKNNNSFARELQTDETTRLLALIKYFSPRHPLLYIIIVLILLLFIYFLKFLISGPKTLGHIYETLEFYVLYFFLITIFLCNIFNLLQDYAAKYSLNREMHNKEPYLFPFTIFNKLYYITLVFMFIFLVYLFITMLLHSPLTIGIIILFIIIIYLFQYIYKKILYQIESGWIQKLLKVFVVIIYIDILYASFHIDIPIFVNVTPYMTDLNVEETKSNNILVSSNTWSLLSDNQTNTLKYENINSCMNKDIALEVFKNKIIYYEREARMPTNEEIDRITEEKGSWTSNDVPYSSYEQAASQMKVYQSFLVDQCYYNDYAFIALKNNIVIVCYIQAEDNYIDNILHHYFNNNL